MKRKEHLREQTTTKLKKQEADIGPDDENAEVQLGRSFSQRMRPMVAIDRLVDLRVEVGRNAGKRCEG